MAEVTGLTATRMLEIEGKSIVSGRQDGDNLYLTALNGDEFGPFNFRGATGAQAPQGVPGEVVQADLDDLETALKAYADAAVDLSGRGLVAHAETNVDQFVSGVADSWATITNVSQTFNFVSGRAYRIDFGTCIQMGAGSTADNDIDLELRRAGSSILRRVSVKGTTDGRTSAVVGSHVVKASPWNGNQTLDMRFRKREAANVNVYNSYSPSFISITDLGSAFV